VERQIQTTSDGSTTIHIKDWNESYHSRHGAIQEALHVFIGNGLNLFDGKVAIMEIGFGTGLNAFVTFLSALDRNLVVDYTGIEAFPISEDEANAMNFVDQLQANQHRHVFEKMHGAPWGELISIDPKFNFTKRRQFFQEITDSDKYDLIFFDAFGFDVQPELWSADIFRRMFNALKPGGMLVTYAARGIVKRNMMDAGFTVAKLAGPPGKREMFRAQKA